LKKFLSMAITLVFLSAFILTACKDPNDDNSKDSAVSTTSADGRCVADIPERNYEGRTFTFLTCGPNALQESEIVYNTYDDGKEEKLSEVVNDAIKTRNNAVEQLLNIKIEEQYIFDTAGRNNGLFYNKIRTDIQAGSGDYYVVAPCIYDGATLAAGGSLYDLLSDIPYLNMEQLWWDQTFNEELTINNSLYFTVGDLGYVNKSATAVLIFNKALIAKYNLENPYELVDNMEWTMDKVFGMAKTISNDDNQDGKIDYKDSMGWSGQLDDMWSLFYGSGEKIAAIGSDGYPELTMYNERSVNVLDKMLGLVQDKQHYISANDYFSEAKWPTGLTVQPFVAGRCLFFGAGINCTDYLDNMSDDFGIVPVPLYDENQDEYHSLINPWVSTCFAVPVSVAEEDLEFVGIVLEAIGAESRNYVYPAYYEVALKYQKTRDDESTRMLDKIFESRGCDLGMIYKWGQLDSLLHQLAAQEPGTFASSYESKKDAAQTALETTNNYYKQLD